MALDAMIHQVAVPAPRDCRIASATTSSPWPTARVIFHAANGENSELKVEVARTGQERATGLMNRKQLDADSGMIFVWDDPVRSGFWMKDTYIPLSIAFIAEDGTIVDIQDMQPLDLSDPRTGKPVCLCGRG